MSLLVTLLPLISDVVRKIIPDKEKAAELEIELIKQVNTLDVQQIQVNMKEAEHGSVFVAGWRPFIGWVCGVALAVRFLILPVLEAICIMSGYPIVLPEINMTELMAILGGILGLGGMRTYERLKGVERTDIIPTKELERKQLERKQPR